jgi:O-antigen ligase
MAKSRFNISQWVSQADSILFISLLILFFCTPLPLGSDRGWAYLALSGVCLILLAVFLTLHFLKDFFNQEAIKQSKTDPAIFLILLLGIWFFMQGGLQIPLNILARIAPVTHDIYLSAFSALNLKDPGSTAVISLDKGQTYNKALLTLACFSVVYLMGQLINTPQRLKTFCYVILCSGVFQAVFGILMTLTGKEYLFFTPKTSYIGHATGTFVNRNSLAGYLEMTLSVGIGVLLATRKASFKNAYHWRGIVQLVIETLLSQVALMRGLLVAMVVGLLMTHSRMGNAAFFNALLITGAIAALSSTHFRKKGFYILLISIVLVDIFLLGTLFDLDVVINRIENTVASKEDRDEVVRSAMHMVPDFWITGSGAGTFAYIFPYYKQQFIPGLYDLAHNDYVQIFLEAGVFGSSLLLLYILVAILRSWKLLRNGTNRLSRGIGFAVLMTVISLLIHSAVDFNLQIPANILLFVAVLALPRVALNISTQVKYE